MPALSFLSSTMERASQAVARTSTGGKPTEMGVRYLSKNYAIELSHLHVDRGMHDRQPEGLRQLHRRHDVLQHHVRSMDWTAAICQGWESTTRRAACWGVRRWEASASRIALMGAPTIRSRGRGGSTASPGTSCSR